MSLLNSNYIAEQQIVGSDLNATNATVNDITLTGVQNFDAGLSYAVGATLKNPNNSLLYTLLVNYIGGSGGINFNNPAIVMPYASAYWSIGAPNIRNTNYTLTPLDTTIYATASNITLSLPPLANVTVGHPYVIKLANVFNVTVTTTDLTLIDTDSSLILNSFQCLIVSPTTTGWIIVSIYTENSPVIPTFIAYTVTEAEGYPANGTLMLPSGVGSCLLLGNDGALYNTTLTTFTAATELQYVYCNVVNSTYLSTGLLVLGSSAISGDGAFLIGDDGNLYDAVYDGTVFTPIGTVVTNVTASYLYPVNGVLLQKAGAIFGNAAALFGSDGGIYDINTNAHPDNNWIPTDGSGASLAFTINYATFSPFNNMIFFNASISYPATGSTLAAQINGLPLPGTNVQLNNIGITNNGILITPQVTGSTIVLTDSQNVPILNNQLSGATLLISGTYQT
jgi:hypothetical protein